MVSPLVMSASCVRQSYLPVFGVERDRVSVERVVEDLAVGVDGAAVDPVAAGLALGAATGSDRISTSGAPGLVRSSAYSMFGQGATTYIVLFTTMGAASWPRGTPVSNVHASFSSATFAGIDLVERAVARVGVVLGGAYPLAIVLLQRSGIGIGRPPDDAGCSTF